MRIKPYTFWHALRVLNNHTLITFMRTSYCRYLAVAMGIGLLLGACSGGDADTPLLKGHVEGLDEKSEVVLVYSFDGNAAMDIYEEVEPDSMGSFVFSPDVPEGFDFMEVEVNINGAPYGVYVKRGYTSEISVGAVDADGNRSVAYGGDNADVSNAVNEAVQAYDSMRYFAFDEAASKPYEEYIRMLDDGNARVLAALESIGDASERDSFSRLYALKYMGRRLSILSYKLYNEGLNTVNEMLGNAEYKAMFDRIDINDPMTVKAGLTGLWVSCNEPYHTNWDAPDVDSLIMNLRFIDENVTEPANRRAAINSAPFLYIMKMSPAKADAQKYMDVYEAVAADYPEFVEKYRRVVDGIVDLTDGEKMSYYPVLTTPDGKEVALGELLGKIVYIDVWATWCGPCCKEIPYMDELVKRFKGNDRIRFISVSVDSDREAWLEKLAKDKPEWEQYVLSEEEHKKFMDALGIQGIPRFILLDAEGRFIQNDALRPSDENIDEVLKSAIK